MWRVDARSRRRNLIAASAYRRIQTDKDIWRNSWNLRCRRFCILAAVGIFLQVETLAAGFVARPHLHTRKTR